MHSIQVHLFGKFRINVVPATIIEFGSSKAKELFCYLMLNLDRPHLREALMCLLWNDADKNHSRRYLRKTLWQLQSAIGSRSDEKADSLLLVGSDWVQVNQEADIWIDAVILEEAYNQVKGIQVSQLTNSQMRVMETAVNLYQGDLLGGWYQEWCIFERERLQLLYLLILDKLVGFSEINGQYEQGIHYASRILRCDHTRERTHRCLMRLFTFAGFRTAALRQYKKCYTILDEELGVSPTDRTSYLYKRIKSGAQLDFSGPAAVEQVNPPVQTLFPEMIDQLQSMKQTINRMQNLLRELII
jgi:DNA-binding SARP family transcriptional activator